MNAVRILVAVVFVCLGGTLLFGQQDVLIHRSEGVTVGMAEAGVQVAGAAAPDQNVLNLKRDKDTFQFVAAEMSFGGKVVKGKPYSAEAVTETNQILSDGNRISSKMSASVYRDGEGRTRREQTLGMIGPFKPSGPPPQTINIDDPVAGVHWMLDPQAKVARKVMIPEAVSVRHGLGSTSSAETRDVRIEVRSMSGAVPHAAPAGGAVTMTGGVAGGMPGGIFYKTFAHSDQSKTESLGTQMIEGVQAEGTRTLTTIPAGEIGNERPIEIVFERWYSPQLETVVMTRHNDPRQGETVYRLTNIQQVEPAQMLFQVPADYQIEEKPFGIRVPPPLPSDVRK